MTKRSTGRRALLIAAGTAAVAAAAGPAAAQSSELIGSVAFVDGATIPQGQLDIYLEDPSVQDKARRRIAEALIESDGKSKQVPFSLTLPTGAVPSPAQRIVVRLERADGWLLARGSAQISAGSAAEIKLREVSY